MVWLILVMGVVIASIGVAAFVGGLYFIQRDDDEERAEADAEAAIRRG